MATRHHEVGRLDEGVNAEGKEPVEINGPDSVLWCDVDDFLKNDRTFVESVVWAKDRQAGKCASPLMIGQLIELGPRCFGKSDGWYWIVP